MRTASVSVPKSITSCSDKHFEHRVTQMDAAVVECHRDLHRTSTLAILPSSNVNLIGSVRPSACTIATACPSFRTSIPSSCTAGSSPSMQNPGETSAKKRLDRLRLSHATRSSSADARATTLSRL